MSGNLFRFHSFETDLHRPVCTMGQWIGRGFRRAMLGMTFDLSIICSWISFACMRSKVLVSRKVHAVVEHAKANNLQWLCANSARVICARTATRHIVT